MSDWPIRTIAECADDVPYATQIGPFGKALTPAAYRPTGVPLLRGVNVNHGRFHDDDFVFISEADADRLSKFESFPGDVLLVHKGTLGKIGLMPTTRRFARYVMGNSMLRVRCHPERLIPEYLYYWLSSEAGSHYLLSRVSQVGVPQIQRPLTTLREAQLPVPPLAEQRAIVGVLGALDHKIEQNQRTAQSLERLARAIFRAWFVDFEPVKAKAAGATAFPAVPQPVFDALPTRFVDSDIGPVPKGWEVGKLGDRCGINQRSVRAGEMSGAIEYVDISSVTVGRLTGLQRVPFSEAPSRARRRIAHGDTIWSCVRPNHRSHLFIHSPPEKRIVSTGFAVLSPREFGASLLHEMTTQPEFVDYLVSNADGSAYPAVKPDHFASAKVVMPPKHLRDAFEEITMPLRDSLAATERESTALAEMRDYLLPKLLSGDIRVN